MPRKLHFIGNVLPSQKQADEHPESGTRSFHITQEESSGMDLTGVPIRLEHADSLTLGTVQKSWNDTAGRKWVIGEIDDDSVQSKFAGKDLLSPDALFKSLSLQHVHNEYSDGTAMKHPVEVSLVREPRRPGCHVAVVRASVSDSRDYKSTPGNQGDMSTAEQTETTPQAPPALKSEAEGKDAATPAAAEEEATNTDLMKQVLGFHQANEALEQEKRELQAELDDMKKANEVRQKKQQEEQEQYIKKLTDSVLEQVVHLSPDFKGQDTTDAINKMAASHPEEVRRVLEIAHCASKKNAELEQKLKAAEEGFEKRLLESKYNEVVQNKAGVHVPETSTAVQASAKKRKIEDGLDASNPYALQSKPEPYNLGGSSNMSTQQIREAYRGLQGSGSMLDCMKNIGGILGTQRGAGFR